MTTVAGNRGGAGAIADEEYDDYVCTNGHDLCYGGVSAGPECPYCERRKRRTPAQTPAQRKGGIIGDPQEPPDVP
jgi:hypothetical protein